MNKYEKRVGFYRGLGVGSVAGVTAFGATLPMDFVKQYIQSGHTYRDIGSILRKNGIEKLWRGMGIGSAIVAPQMAIKFGVYNGLHRIESVRNNGVVGDLGAGFVAGCVDGAFLGVPLAVQAIQQMNTKIKVGDGFKEVLSIGSCRFMIPLAMRNGSYTMFMLGGVYPTRRAIFGENSSSIEFSRYLFQTFIASSVLNIGGCILSSPWDVIRAHQVDKAVKRVGDTTVRGVVRSVMRKEGVGGFYRGFGNYMLTFGMRFPLTVVLAELMKNRFFD